MQRRTFGRSALAVLVAGLALCTLVPGARAEPVPGLHLENLVPARSLAFLALEDIGTWEARVERLALVKMVNDPEMRPFVDPLKEDLKALLKGGPGKESPLPPVVFEVLRALAGLRGQVGVALVGFDPERGPSIAGALDFGDRLGDFVAFLGRMKEQMADEMHVTAETKDGRLWWTIGDPAKPAAFATTLRTSVLVSTDRSWVESVVTADGAAAAGSLGEGEGFRRAREGAGGGETALFAYANVPGILDLATKEVGPDARRVMDALGVDTMKSAAYSMSFRGDGILDTILVDAPGAKHGILPMLKMRPATRKGLALAPANAFAYEESTFPLSTLAGNVREILTRIDPAMQDKMDQALAQAREATGVDVEKDLLGALADDLAYHIAIPTTGGLFPEVVVSVAVKDPAAFETTFSKAVDGLLEHVGRSEEVSGRQRVIDWKGRKLHVIDLQATQGDDPIPFTPTWTMLGDRWVATLVPHTMKELLLRLDAGEKGLEGQEDFQSLVAAGPKGAGGVSYVDLQAVLALLYDTGVPLLQTVAKPNVLQQVPVRLDWAMLPPTRTMRPYFRSIGMFSECDGQTLKFAVHSPVGYVLPVMLVAGVAATFGMRRGGSGISPELVVEPVPEGDESLGLVADLQARQLLMTVHAYYVATGRLPASLRVLLQEKNPASDDPWLEDLGNDPWGSPWEYVVKDAAKGGFEVRSYGKDTVPNTADDVVVVSGE
jgi:hypothetical protein